jgi:hypothetical protein
MNIATPWHRASYLRLLNEWLPEMLAERLPLQSYRVGDVDTATCRVTVGLPGLEVAYELPMPDERGLFHVAGELRVVIPIATHQVLNEATLRCVGEQVRDYINARLGQATTDLPWDLVLARAWLPLDTWVHEVLAGIGERFRTGQRADDTNWLALHTHLRRVIIPDRQDVIAPGQLGYVCPFETPEGPNIGHILTIAGGAEIQEGRLVVVDDRPEAKLGLSASMIPFLEHSDTNRLLMGANMLRQWIPQSTPEPALVQTGNEPDPLLAPDFWCGRNLLTAFVSWGTGTYEDAIVVSQSCARRFDVPYALELGDKLSDRHGTKGVVGAILTDDEMPHLPDGTPVDLVYNFANVHKRLNFSQVRDALAGWIAKVTSAPVIVPPFGAPTSEELRDRCRRVGLPESGMVTLTLGKDGPPLELPSTVGYAYWGRLFHLAQHKLRAFVQVPPRQGQRLGEMETFMLRDLGAYETIRESLNTRSIWCPDAEGLVSRVVAESVVQAPPPTPLFTDLQRRLRVAGIEAVLDAGQVTFQFAPPSKESLKLARAVPHPWLFERALTEIGLPEPAGLAASDDPWTMILPTRQVPLSVEHQPPPLVLALIETNDRLARMMADGAPSTLVEDATAQLEARVRDLFAELLMPVHLRLGERVLFSGRTVLVPAANLSLEQLGLPDAMAWELFGPLAARELGGDVDAVALQTASATQALDAAMARSWVIFNRAPTLEPTALLAFHPVRVSGSAMHLHPLLCKWLNGDFDGDQAAVFLPITEAGQREAGEYLSVAAHLKRDPKLIASLAPALDMLWGLAWLSRRPDGLSRIAEAAGTGVAASGGFVTQDTLAAALEETLQRGGVDAAMAAVQALMVLGLEAVQRSGASISPFLGEGFPIPPQLQDNGVEAWSLHREAVVEALSASRDYDNPAIGPQLLMAKARGLGIDHIAWHLTGRGPVVGLDGLGPMVRHGYVEGLTPDEMFVLVVGARRGLAQVVAEWQRLGASFRDRSVSRSFSVLARALRAEHPGLVFARAAAQAEVDPLVDVESRLLVGLPVDG